MSDPITREETYLAALSGEAVSLPDPITRNEMYLAYLCGMDVNLPAPITRKDYFMYTLCQQGVGGGGVTIRNQDKTITENGSYKADSGYTGLGTVTVAVPQEEPVVEPLEVTENGTYNPPAGVDGYGPVTVNVETSGGSGGGDDVARAIVDRTIAQYDDNDVVSIGNNAFSECTSLQTVSLPAVTTIGASAFYKCTSLQTVSLPAVTTIGASAFSGCSKLTDVLFPNITGINQKIFDGCSSLTHLTFINISSVPQYAMANCSALEEVLFKACNNARVFNNVFSNCGKLKKVDFDGDAYFSGASNFTNCTALEALILRGNECGSLANVNNFTGSSIASGTGYIYVPADLIDTYKAATNWSTFADQFRAIEDYPDICGEASA